MIDVGRKTVTFRRAEAAGLIRLAPATLLRLQRGDTPKPDVLATARAAGLLAAKRTPDLIPHCHVVPLESLTLTFTESADGILANAVVTAIARTGVEMEALVAVQTALVVIYDMLKAVDDGMEITGVKLLEKSGGKGDFAHRVPAGFKAAVVVSSDRVSAGEAVDKTGPWLLERLKGLGVEMPAYHVLPDEEPQLRALFLKLAEEGMDLVISTGGTGLSKRDRTVEALRPILDKELPGAMEAARAYGQDRTPYAMLSRGIAGHRDGTLYVTMPGSMGGVKDTYDALFPALLHAHHVISPVSHAPAGIA
jgi:molybdenum cofactor biosynthesis protein MoaC